MLNIDESLKTIFKNDTIPIVSQNVRKDLEVYFPDLNLTIRTDQIKDDSFSLDESLFSESDIVFGVCEAAQIKFTVAGVDADLTGLEFTINQIIDNNYVVPLGIYKVSSAKKQNDEWFKDVIAYDRMKNIDVDVADWYNSLTFPTPLSVFRASLLSYVGMEEDLRVLPNDNMTVERTIEPSQISGRVVLTACEEINGVFGHMSRTGKLKHVVLEPAYGLYPSFMLYPSNSLLPVSETDKTYAQSNLISENVSKAMYRSVKFEEYTVKEIDKLQIRQEEDDIGAIVGTGSNTYVIEGNFLVFGKSAAELDIIATNTFGNMNKRPYRPYSSESIGLPYAELGDMIAFATDDVVTGYIFKRTLTGIQALVDTYSAPGTLERVQNFSVNKQIIQLLGKTAVIKKSVEEVSVDVSDLAENTSGRFALTDEQIELRVTKAGVISSINQTAEAVTIDANKINFNGYAYFNSSGTLTGIKGNLVKTGSIESTNYISDVTGMKIDLDSGIIDTPNFKVGADGKIAAVDGLFMGEIVGSNFTGGSMNINDKFMVDEYGNLTSSGTSTFGNSAGHTIIDSTGLTVGGSSYGGTTKIWINHIDTGTIDCNAVIVPSINGFLIGSQNLNNYFAPKNLSYLQGVYSNVAIYSNTFRCSTDDELMLGSPSYRWEEVYAVTPTISTSDRNQKHDITDLDEVYRRIILNLKPVKFKYNSGTSDRWHTGFISQDVEDLLKELGLTSFDFAGFIKSPIYSAINEDGEYDTNSEITGYLYGLRYEEFISPIVSVIHELKNDVELLKKGAGI